MSTGVEERSESAWGLLRPGSGVQALGVAVMLAMAVHAAGAVLFLASWLRQPQSPLWLVMGLLSFAAALGLWRMLAWARLVTVLMLWLGAAIAGLALIRMFVSAPALATVPATPLVAGVAAITAAVWVIHLLGKHKTHFHDRLL